jgi:hypothetical protein
MLLEILAGAGNLPAFTNRQSVARENGRLPDWKSAFALTKALSGSRSMSKYGEDSVFLSGI